MKRAIDIAGSLVLITILSPLLVVVWAILLTEGGGALYYSRRLSNGRAFDCFKFRTMRANAEKLLNDILASDAEARDSWESHRKIKNDPRITKIGDFLRKSSLDELPQLFNVLKGDMSLVGPRPITQDEVRYYTEEQFEKYSSVRAGMTGLWQISGRSNVSYDERAKLDASYVDNLSVLTDIKIIFKTPLVLLNRNGAY